MKPRRIDFLISNDGHHVATFDPVIRRMRTLSDDQYSFQYVSLCELRGIPTPSDLSLEAGRPALRLFPSRVRRSTAAGKQSGAVSRSARRFARRLLSRLYLRRRIAEWLSGEPDVVVLPNDAAFPYDLVCAMLRQRSIPFVLVQEGIRFPLPGDKNTSEYGSGGASRIAIWGQASSDYFLSAGADESHLRLTGCPRFDQIEQTDWSEASARIRERFGTRQRVLTLLTNPIDDQGFCSTGEKLELVARFVRGISSVLEKENCTLLLKLHGRESARDYRSALAATPLMDESVKIVERVPLYPLLAGSSAAFTLASTAGLEALLFDLPLGVVKLPAAGYVHDYVSSGAAWGLESNGTTSERVREMLSTPHMRRTAVNTYLERQVSRRAGSAASVADVIKETASLRG